MERNAESDLQRNEVFQTVPIQQDLLPSRWHSSCARLLLPSENQPKASVPHRLFSLGDLHGEGLQNSQLSSAASDV